MSNSYLDFNKKDMKLPAFKRTSKTGMPCKQCGGITRFLKDGYCVKCKKELEASNKSKQ